LVNQSTPVAVLAFKVKELAVSANTVPDRLAIPNAHMQSWGHTMRFYFIYISSLSFITATGWASALYL
jgi:hypothetical protein